MRKPAIQYLLIISVFLLLLSCAKMEFPSGGPPDTTPPEIMSSSPEPNSLNVPLDTDVRINFSEKMTKNEARAALFIVPEPEEFPDLDWKGEDLVIKFKKELEKDRTYLITIKTTLNDLHKNRLARPYSLAFSTGSYLDTSWIAGMVYQDRRPAGNIDVWAFPYDTNFVIYDKEPLYITQSTDSGNYRMPYMADGRYLTFAVKDRAGDRKFNPIDDLLGLPIKVAVLDSLHLGIAGMNFVLSKFDTTALAIVAAEYTNDLTISVKFSANLFAPNLVPGNFKIDREGIPEPVSITDLYYFRDTTDRVMLIPEGLLEPGKYLLRGEDITSIDGNHLSPELDSASFEVAITEDVEKPKLVSSFPSEAYEAFPPDTSLEFYFSEPIMVDSSDTALLYLLTEDSTRFDNFTYSAEGITLYAQSGEPLQEGAKYSAFLDLQGITDRFGRNRAGDSAFIVDFATLNTEDFGSISGKFVNWERYLMPRIFVSSLDQKVIKPVVPDSSSKFLVDLPAGRYSFYGYDDVNGNGKYDRGRVNPLEFAEPFFVFPDTISVRSRFETEGVSINLK